MATPPSSIDPNSGFCSANSIYYSLRPPRSLPSPSLPLSIYSYLLSVLPSPPPPHAAIIFSSSSSSSPSSVSFPLLLSQITSLAASLRSYLRISKGDVIYILAPTSLEIPILYLALLSIGAIVSPSNPLSSPDEIAHQLRLINPSIAFTTASFASKLPHRLNVVLLDSPLFRSFLEPRSASLHPIEINQHDPAAILYSSGTTGRVKGVVITHRNLIALIAGYVASREVNPVENGPSVTLFTIPLFHVFGFFMIIRTIALGDTGVLMDKVDLPAILHAVQAHRVRVIPVSPPLVLALAKSDLVPKFDISSLEGVGCGGAPLRRELAELFSARFPSVNVHQGYGLTESCGSAATQSDPEECRMFGSTGKLSAGLEAKIVDPSTGDALPPGLQGELWLRGPTIMKGYIGDDEATASTLDSEGWLKTGDLCYFDQNGFLFIVDRLKELIKYKAYQVPPAELEQILQSHPEIADAAVIPYPDEEAGQIPMAFVVRQPGSSITENQIMKFVAKQVSPYKKIRRVAFTSSIPKSAAGKILRRELVNYALSTPTSKL